MLKINRYREKTKTKNEEIRSAQRRKKSVSSEKSMPAKYMNTITSEMTRLAVMPVFIKTGIFAGILSFCTVSSVSAIIPSRLPNMLYYTTIIYSMKKFIVTLFILLILGGVVFFFGWAQFKVPPGSYGIVNSKTHGVDSRVIRPGEFRWIWYKLIPTNVIITVFNLDTVNHSINVNNSLPSGSSYASFAGISADFSWELGASISFILDPEQLAVLAAQHNFGSQEALDAYERDLAQQIEVFIIRQLFVNEDSQRLEGILSGSGAEIEQEVQRQFPQIKDFSFVVKKIRLPDFALYRQVRVLYEDFIAKQREFVSEALSRRAEAHIETQLHFSDLERYGQLLEKFPVLIEYLALEKGKVE